MINKYWKASGYILIGIVMYVLYMPLLRVMGITLENGDPVNTITSNEEMMDAIFVSVYVTVITVVISVFVATFAAIGFPSLGRKTKDLVNTGTKLPLVSPDIVMALGMSIFLFAIFGVNMVTNLGQQYNRMIIAHIAFGIAYAFITILPVARKLGRNLTEASMDLGASPLKTVRKVIIPNLKGAIIAGAAIVFVMSFDDYIISKMAAPLIVNISVYFSSTRRLLNILPSMYALTTIMIVIALFIAAATFILRREKNEK